MEQAEGSHAPLGPTMAEGWLKQATKIWWLTESAYERLKMAMSSRQDSPHDYDDSEERSREVLSILRRLMARPSGGDNNYYEGGNGDKRLQSAILTGIILLAVGGIGGGIAMYGKLSAIERGVTDHDARIQRLERIDERRYRGPNGTP